jgi:rhodanese-related sulfurtransferase
MARINAAASLLQRGQPVISDFSDLELSYAPPFSTAVDILNAAANVADNLISGRLDVVPIDDFVSWMDGKEEAAGADWVALDLRHPREAAPFEEKFPERWLAMPYDKVRALCGELPRGKTLILICNAGTRSYEIQCFLRSVNVLNTLVLPGGLNVLKRLGLSWLE